MILKLRLSKERVKEISEELIHMGVSISEDSELILTEENYLSGELYCKDNTDRVVIGISEILYIESMGKNIYVHTKDKTYTTASRVYELEKKLPDELFIRISNSVIINRNAIKRVTPALGQKFYLTLKNDDKVVTYPLGNISFVSVTGDVGLLYGACDSLLKDNEWSFLISGKNEDAFIINDCIFASQDTFTYIYEKGVAYEPGSELEYSVKVRCNAEDGDLLIMNPIFELSMAQTQKKLYYTPGILISNYANLSYYEIREYVSK